MWTMCLWERGVGGQQSNCVQLSTQLYLKSLPTRQNDDVRHKWADLHSQCYKWGGLFVPGVTKENVYNWILETNGDEEKPPCNTPWPASSTYIPGRASQSQWMLRKMLIGHTKILASNVPTIGPDGDGENRIKRAVNTTFYTSAKCQSF